MPKDAAFAARCLHGQQSELLLIASHRDIKIDLVLLGG